LLFFLNVTTSFAVLPGWINGKRLPLILKSCEICPMFLKTNVTLPGFAIDFVESLKKNSPPLSLHFDVHDRRARVLGRVRQRLRDDVVGRHLDGLRQSRLGMHV
jgi:hypothetical protein